MHSAKQSGGPPGFRLEGRFDGMIREAHVTRLAETIATLDGWYLLEPGNLPSLGEMQPVSGGEAQRHLRGLVDEILREERGVWTTMVYVQSAEDPWIIKVFHPRRAGCGCGGSGGILPWWVLSRVRPDTLDLLSPEQCAIPAKPGGTWWKRLF